MKRALSEADALDLVKDFYDSHHPLYRPPRTLTPVLHSKSRTLPLTCDNLLLLEESACNRPTSQSASTMAGSLSPSHTKNTFDVRLKLNDYGILVDDMVKLPPPLASYVADFILKPREVADEVSPNSKKIHGKRKFAINQNERDGIRSLEPYLLFRGEVEQEDCVSPVPLICSKHEAYLSRNFLPQAPNRDVRKLWGELSQPRTDSATGYVTCKDAKAVDPPAQMPFTEAEEIVLRDYSINQFIHFPFLTSQWKSQIAGENESDAENQAARDGAVIVNYLHIFYSTAYERRPSLVESCHFSVTCDLKGANVWIHWRDGMTHHMESISECSFRKEKEIEEIRCVLRNIVSYATGERLISIKKAIPEFAKNKANKSRKSASATSPPPIVFPKPPASTPLSELTRKRIRVSLGDEDYGLVEHN